MKTTSRINAASHNIEYEKLRIAQKKALLVAIGLSVVVLGLGVLAGVSNWLWAIPFCAFYLYFWVATAYLTHKLRRKGSPFVPSRREVFKWMFTFKVENN